VYSGVTLEDECLFNKEYKIIKLVVSYFNEQMLL